MTIVSDGAVTPFGFVQATPPALPVAGQLNLVQASNVSENLTLRAPLLTSNNDVSRFALASTSNPEVHSVREHALISFMRGESEAILQPLSATILPERPYLPSAGAESALSADVFKAATYPLIRQKALRQNIQPFTGFLDLLRAPIAATLSKSVRKTELHKKMMVLERLLERRQPNVTLELADLDLRMMDFATLRMPLENIHFINCLLGGTRLQATFNHCQMTECDADNAILDHAVFINCVITRLHLNQAQLQSTQFTRCTLSYVEMRAAEANNAIFTGTELTGCDISHATLTQCRFPGSTLANNIWTGTTTRDNVFNSCTLTGVFCGANFSEDSMRNVAIAEADFRGVILADNCTLARPTEAEQQRFFSAENPLSVKLLNAIHTSEEGDLAIKTRLMRQLVKQLGLTDSPIPPDVVRSLLSTLTTLPYRDDSRINAFISTLFRYLEPESITSSLSADALAARRLALAILRNPASEDQRMHEERNRHTKMQLLGQIVNHSRDGSQRILHGVNIPEITFNGWNFDNIDLSWADFRLTQFHNCRFSNCRLHAALMQKCYFINCEFLDNVDITAANLTDATMMDCRLSGIEASRAILLRVRLDDVEMQDANLSGADISGSYLINSNFTGSDFSAASFHRARMISIFLDDTLMSECIMDDSTLQNVSLINADLSSASMARIDLVNAWLEDTQLNDSLTLGLPDWNSSRLTIYLSSPEDGLLNTLERIPPQYGTLKIRLAEQLVSSLQHSGMDLVTLTKPLLNILGRHFWRQSAQVQAFNDQLIGQYLAAHDLCVLPTLGRRMLATLLDNLQHNLSLACASTNAFTQLINQAAFTLHQDDLQLLAQRLYSAWLQHPVIQTSLAQRNSVEIFDRLRRSETDWRDSQAANFLLISAQTDGPLMLVSGENLLRMLSPAICASWNSFWLINDNRVLQHADYTTAQLVEHHFPLFHASWLAQQRLNPLERIIAALNLGDDLYTLFMHAASQPVSTHKLTDMVALQALQQIFQPLLQFAEDGSRECTLAEHHYKDILQLYGLQDASDREKAETLFSLAIIFTRYCSATHFGDEENSPPVIRLYAFACMMMAYQLAPEIFIVGPLPDAVAPNTDYYQEWRGRLLGTAPQEELARAAIETNDEDAGDAVNYSHCADTLATHMLGLAQMVCSETINRFYPPTWN